MPLTSEQQAIVDYVKQPATEDRLVLVSSCAGSGKTTLLVSIANTIKHRRGLYICYNKSIALEAATKFPVSTACSTTHSLAYQATVKPYGLRLGNFSYRSIKERIRYENKCALVDDIREFCLSKYISYDEFAKETGIPKDSAKLANKYLSLMQSGSIECTHEFYLKYFHILLSTGDVVFDPFDFIMIDEAGDLNEVTLEIFKLLPSKLKIAVGDPHQNIYAFNHTVNCFELLEDEGKLFYMSTSFRVNKYIAARIEKFVQKTLDPRMAFKGVETDDVITTQGFLSRTNAALIRKMIELNASNTPYGLVRKASEIFKLPLMLASMKYQGYVTDPNYKHLQTHFDEWFEDPSLQAKHKTPLIYISSLFSDDIQLTGAIRLIVSHGKKLIFDTYREASNHESRNHSLILCTAHSAKGLEFDEVFIDNSLNQMVTTALNNGVVNRAYIDAMNLYYVACSRARKSLLNATALNI